VSTLESPPVVSIPDERTAPPEHKPVSLTTRIVTLAVVVMPFVGLLAAIASLWGYGFHWHHAVMLFVGYVLTGFGITVGFHRLFTHKSFETSRPVTFLFGVLGSMAAEGPLFHWVANHRKHHQHSDDDHDPHSPHHHGEGMWNVIRGAWHAHVGWLFATEQAQISRYIMDLRKDRMLRYINKMFPVWVLLGLLIPSVIGGLIMMSWTGAFLGLLWGGAVRMFVVHHITWSINSVCHIWGRRDFRSHDESRNNTLFGILGLGEGWHNNHHAFPTSARHGLKWWQIDTSYMLIKFMQWTGLAWKLRTPAPAQIEAKKLTA
jgi:stearoyl-CoA desaturase (delta-9 desaturase)